LWNNVRNFQSSVTDRLTKTDTFLLSVCKCLNFNCYFSGKVAIENFQLKICHSMKKQRLVFVKDVVIRGCHNLNNLTILLE
jgi:hypothetical protein